MTVIRPTDLCYSEDRLYASLALVAADGHTLGTACVIAPGRAITCHHVVGSRDRLTLKFAGLSDVDGEVRLAERFPEIDVAIIRFSGPSPPPYPAETRYDRVLHVRSLGYCYADHGIEGPFPFGGRIAGTAKGIVYSYGQRYNISTALRVKDDNFDAGMSGAPLVDEDTGVAIGLINAKLNISGQSGGFALPLKLVAEASTRLARLLAYNKRCIPRYGRFINYAGVSRLTRAITDDALEWLTSTDLYRPRSYVQREPVEAEITLFLKSHDAVLVLVGDSGTGKTQVIAHVAGKLTDRLALLLASRQPELNNAGLATAISRRLACITGVAIPGDAVFHGKEPVAGRPVILVDGLNELSELDAFIADCVDWAVRGRARFILSIRSEMWPVAAARIPNSLLYEPSNRGSTTSVTTTPPPYVSIGDYSPDEEAAAKEHYGLGQTGMPLSHPLLMRVVAEIPVRRGDSSITRVDAYQRFADQKCEAVAARTACSSKLIQDRIDLLAREALTVGGLTVGAHEFSDAFPDMKVATAVLDEKLLIKSGDHYHFPFEELGAYFIARSFHEASALIARVAANDAHASTALVFWLLREAICGDEPRAVKTFAKITQAGPPGQTGKFSATDPMACVIRLVLEETKSVDVFLSDVNVSAEVVASALSGWAMDTKGVAGNFERVVEIACCLAGRQPQDTYYLGWLIEGILYSVSTDKQRARSMSLVDGLLRDGDARSRSCLAYFCRGCEPERNAFGLRGEIISKLIGIEEDVGNLEIIVEGLLVELVDRQAGSCARRAHEQLALLAQRIDLEKFDEMLFLGFLRHASDDRLVSGLRRIVSRRPKVRVGPHIERILYLTGRGASAHDAALVVAAES